jgi:CSLREA domain-containing protein
LWAAVILFATMGLARVQSAGVSAATMTVDSTADAVDANLDDGICAASTGACTLRAALQEANARSGPDTITVPPGIYTLTLPGDDDQATVGDLDITDDVTIVGTGQTATFVDGGAIDRVFETWNLTTTVTIAHLTIRNGRTATIIDGGGLVTRSQTTLNDLVISDNIAHNAGGLLVAGGNAILTNVTVSGNWGDFTGVSRGGGIFNAGMLTLNSSVVDDNIAWDGAGIANSGVLILNNSTVRNNENYDGDGGGLYNYYRGNATLTNSSVSDNISNGAGGGGGIMNTGMLSLDRSTVSGNVASNSGGGIFNWATGVLEITNSTIGNNTATAEVGGIAGGSSSVRIESSTITNNSGGTVGGIAYKGSTLTIQGTIVAGNSGSSAPDCSGTLTSQGYNLIGTSTGCTVAAVGGDQVGNDASPIDPKLGPLQDNGGPTFTHALLPGSPAIDAGDNLTCSPKDQRGLVRPEGVACDIGAVEGLAPPALQVASITASAPITISAGDSLTLTVVLTNPNTLNQLTGMTLDVPLPAGLQIAGAPLAATDCSGSLEAAPSGSAIRFSGGQIEASATCSISVPLRGTQPGAYTITPGAASALESGPGSPGNTVQVVVEPLAPPTLQVELMTASTPITISAGDSLTLTLVLTNPNARNQLTSVTLDVPLPAGLQVAGAPPVATDCGGTLAAPSDGSAIQLSGGEIEAGAVCRIKVAIIGTTPGAYTIAPGAASAIESGPGSPASTVRVTVTPAQPPPRRLYLPLVTRAPSN